MKWLPAPVYRRLIALFFIAINHHTAWADLLPVPALASRVIDQTATLTANEQLQLVQQIAQLEAETGAQLAILMVPSTATEDIASYSKRIANTWKLGRAQVGDGVLIVVAKNDRRMRIEVARALESQISDQRAARIIDEQMKPAFRDNRFAAGLGAAVVQLGAAIRQAPAVAPERKRIRPAPSRPGLQAIYLAGRGCAA